MTVIATGVSTRCYVNDYGPAAYTGRLIDVSHGIARRLAERWRLERIDATARAILRAGAVELLRLADVPSEVVIDEYVEIAKSFFDGAEPGFVNGALDAIARDARPT